MKWRFTKGALGDADQAGETLRLARATLERPLNEAAPGHQVFIIETSA